MSEAADKRGFDAAGVGFVLAEFTPYRIVSLGHAISKKLSQAYRDENLTIPEWRVMAVIAQADAMAARDVVAMTPMDKMAVSRAAASLEEKNIVVRKADANDRRVHKLMLSVAGRALFERIAAVAAAYEEELLSSLEPEEARIFNRAMQKLEGHALSADAAANDTIS